MQMQLLLVQKKLIKNWLKNLEKCEGKKFLTYNAESDLTDYLQLYSDLAK